MNGEQTGGGLTPADAFSLLGNEFRIAILRALWEAKDPRAGETTVGFSELYRRVGADDSGKFNYHLEKLVGHYVRRDDEGYTLTNAGEAIVEAVLSGTAIEDPTLEPVVVDDTCIVCGAPVRVGYESGFITVTCTECEGFWAEWDDDGGIIGRMSLPPAGLGDRDGDELLDVSAETLLRSAELAFDGICSTCSSPMAVTLDVCPDHDLGDESTCSTCDRHFLGQFMLVCETCKNTIRAPSFGPLLAHPRTTAFLYDHGVEHFHNSFETFHIGQSCSERLLEEDAPVIELTLTVDDDALVATVDSDLVIEFADE